MLTEATLRHHLQSFGEGVDAILSDYTEDSVLFTPNGPVRGLDRLRTFFDGFIRNSPPELLDAMRLVCQDLDGEVAYIIWRQSLTSQWLLIRLLFVTERSWCRRLQRFHERSVSQLL